MRCNDVVLLALCSALGLMAGSGLALDEPNVIVNPGFEDPAGAADGVLPDNWNSFSSKDTKITVTHENKRSGEQGLKMITQGLPKAHQGIIQKVPVAEGDKYTALIYVINNKNDPLGGTAHGQIAIEWLNDQGKEISRDYSPSWSTSLSKMRWEAISLKRIPAPKGAVQAVIGIHLADGDNGGKGSVFVDDVHVYRD